ncbi:MAG: hypothetical protein Q4B67_08005 [Eubacteriales bacterium]|nr:hypothetical protein [Eubacteriales bacterium]
MIIDVIVYTSKCGHTRRYAELLGERIGKPVYSLDEAAKALSKDSRVLYMGWIHASHIQGFKKAMQQFDLKCVCGVGLCDTGTLKDEVRKATEIPNTLPLFTIQGGMDRSSLKGLDKMLISMLAKGLASKKDKSAEDIRMSELLNSDTDFVCEENLAEVLKFLAR